MTLSVLFPAVGGFVGQGYSVRVGTDIFGPFPPNDEWIVNVERATPLGSLYLTQTLLPITSQLEFQIWGPIKDGRIVSSFQNAAAFSADVQITAVLRDRSTNTSLDGPTTFPGFFWDPYGGIGQLIAAFSGSTTGDTFTGSDRALLQAIDRSVVKPSYVDLRLTLGISGLQNLELLPQTRAVRWSVTTFPATPHVDPGNPDYFFGLGFATPFMAGGSVRSTRVVFSGQVLELPEACHRVDFDLAQGLVVEVMELSIG